MSEVTGFEQDWITVNKAAEITRLSTKTILHHANLGTFEARKERRGPVYRWLIDLRSLEQAIYKNPRWTKKCGLIPPNSEQDNTDSRDIVGRSRCVHCGMLFASRKDLLEHAQRCVAAPRAPLKDQRHMAYLYNNPMVDVHTAIAAMVGILMEENRNQNEIESFVLRWKDIMKTVEKTMQ